MKKEINISLPKGAIFSEDRKYRYALWRIWSNIHPLLLLIGLNPSKANEVNDDPTITRGIVRAYKSGFGGLLMGNLYAYVSTEPKELLRSSNSVGEFTDYYLAQMINLTKIQICGWGSFPPVVKRAPIVLTMLKEPYCLGVNFDGQPKHPLYISYDTPIVSYPISDGKG